MATSTRTSSPTSRSSRDRALLRTRRGSGRAQARPVSAPAVPSHDPRTSSHTLLWRRQLQAGQGGQRATWSRRQAPGSRQPLHPWLWRRRRLVILAFALLQICGVSKSDISRACMYCGLAHARNLYAWFNTVCFCIRRKSQWQLVGRRRSGTLLQLAQVYAGGWPVHRGN